MHDHSFKNEHGRFPVTTDVLQNIQHDIQMLSKAIAGMGGDAAIFTKGGDVAAVDGEVVESHGSGKCIEKLMDSKNFAVQGEIYDVLETTGYLNDNYGRTHSNMFDLPSKFASLEAYDKQLRDTIELRSKDILDYIDTQHNTFASQLGELSTQLAQAVAQLNNQIAQSIADLQAQILEIKSILPPKGLIGTVGWNDEAIKRGWVPCLSDVTPWKDKLIAFWGDKITFSRNGLSVNSCSGIDHTVFRALIGKTINDKTVYIKCL